MATTYRIAVIGSWESVMGFRALGLETYLVTAPEEARETIRELAKSGDCVFIFIAPAETWRHFPWLPPLF